jgi:hypothetical protein
MTTTRPEVRTRWTAVSGGHTAPGGHFICAECRYAQLFAVQPRAVCTRRDAEEADLVLFAGQPACPDGAPREGTELLMAWCSPGPKRMTRRFPSART